VFDIGCQQHGNYTGVEQPDEKAEEEEAAPTLIPKWKAGEIRGRTGRNSCRSRSR